MTVKEYLRQAYRLDNRINSDIDELAQLREMACSISSPMLGERVQTSKSHQAPFVRNVEKIVELEHKIDAEIDLFVDLKSQMRDAINLVNDVDEQLILRYRYIHNMTWEEIGDNLHVDARTARRWHGRALQSVALPENPIKI